MATKNRKKHEQLIVVEDPGVKCPHCGERYDHAVKNANYMKTGRARMWCNACNHPFITQKQKTAFDTARFKA
jgi:transposase-like protein